MNILLAPNNYYIMPTIVLLQSLFDAENDSLDVYVIYSDLTKENVEQLNRFVVEHGGVFHPVFIDADTFASAYTSFHITKEAYYRLLAQDLLPDDLDRVLYLDGDLVVQKTLSELYNMSFMGADGKENYFVVCEGPGVSKRDYSVYDELGIPHEYPYFNSGVLLMNLSLLRQTFDSKILFDFISAHGTNLRFHDQDTLNALFYDKVIYVDWHIYNQTILHIKDKSEADMRLADAAIIHYAGPDKPWKYDYKSWYFNLFWQFARRAGYRKLHIQTKWKRFLWRIKQCVR